MTQSLEDYLEVIGNLEEENHNPRVKDIAERLGLSKGREPEKVEKQLRAILPAEESSDFCQRIVLFGREV